MASGHLHCDFGGCRLDFRLLKRLDAGAEPCAALRFRIRSGTCSCERTGFLEQNLCGKGFRERKKLLCQRRCETCISFGRGVFIGMLTGRKRPVKKQPDLRKDPAAFFSRGSGESFSDDGTIGQSMNRRRTATLFSVPQRERASTS